MKNICTLLLICFITLFTANIAQAKFWIIQKKNPSVQLLDKLTQEGKEVREKDAPYEEVDTTADTTRAKMLKQKFNNDIYKFFPENPYIEEGKSPIEKHRGTIE